MITICALVDLQDVDVASLLSDLAGGCCIIEPIKTAAPNFSWRLMLVKGTEAQVAVLTTLLGGFISICSLSTDETKWPELDNVVDLEKRISINMWLDDNNYPSINENWTNLQTVQYLMTTVFANTYDLALYYI
jgi:hypothetical protein